MNQAERDELRLRLRREQRARLRQQRVLLLLRERGEPLTREALRGRGVPTRAILRDLHEMIRRGDIQCFDDMSRADALYILR